MRCSMPYAIEVGFMGIYGIKDTYVVCKYVKKTVLELGFIWVWFLDPTASDPTWVVQHVGGDHLQGLLEHRVQKV
jgi:hypothetical protein